MGATGSRRGIKTTILTVVAFVILGTGVATADVGPGALNVRDFGARGNGVTNDTAAIQKANDEAAKRGGGQVYFPSGTYIAAGIAQDSYVEFTGSAQAIIKHPNGTSGYPIIGSRLRVSSGSIGKGSRLLTLANSTVVQPGTIVAVRGAGGGSPVQHSTLSQPAASIGSTLSVASVSGFASGATYRPNYLLVGEEIVSYQSVMSKSFIEVQRGMYGTKASTHPIGTRVAQLSVLYARVESVSPAGVMLDREAAVGVSDVPVWAGSVGMKITGLTLDGNRKDTGAEKTSPFPVLYDQAYGAVITGTTIRNADDGAIRFDRGTQASTVSDNVLVDTGSPSMNIGAAVWVFRGSSSNIVSNNYIGGRSYSGVYIDDRTIQSTEWDADARNNVMENNTIRLPRMLDNDGIGILGSSDNVVRSNVVSGSVHGIRVYTGGQGPRPETARNLVEANEVADHRFGIWVDGSDNRFLETRFSAVTRAVYDSGRQNEFA